METAIQVNGLHKSYGDFEAVRGIDFRYFPARCSDCWARTARAKRPPSKSWRGLRPRTSGEVKVLGYDPATDVRAIKDRIGVCLQSTNLPDKITVREALGLFAAFYSRNIDNDKLIQRLQLVGKAR